MADINKLANTHGDVPPPEEALAIAKLLGCRPSQLRAVKMDSQDGGGTLPHEPPPAIDGFRAPSRFTLDYAAYDWEKGSVRYDSANGSLVVVEHESGAVIWHLVEVTATVMGLFGISVLDVFKWIRAHRFAGPNPQTARVYRFKDDGTPDGAAEDFDESEAAPTQPSES